MEKKTLKMNTKKIIHHEVELQVHSKKHSIFDLSWSCFINWLIFFWRISLNNCDHKISAVFQLVTAYESNWYFQRVKPLFQKFSKLYYYNFFVLVWWLNFSITLSITILTILSNDNTHMMHEGEKSFIKKSFILDIPSIYI